MTARECKTSLSGDIKRAMGQSVSEQDELEEAAHLADCPLCRAERELYTTMGQDRGADPAPPLDELTSRRIINDVIAAHAGGATCMPSPKAQHRTPGMPLRFGLGWAFSGAAVGAVATVFCFLLLGNPGQGSGTGRPPTPSTDAVAETGRLALVSAGLRVAGQSASVGAEVEAGQQVETGQGAAAISFDRDLGVGLEKNTTIVTASDPEKGLAITLRSGGLWATLPPGSRENPLRIVTTHGVVDVVGTALSVRYVGEKVHVSVLRGNVEMSHEQSGDRQSLGPSQGGVLGTAQPTYLSDDAQNTLWEKVFALEQLRRRTRGTLEIKTEPPGALFAVDGVRGFAKTPAQIAISPGHHKLSVWLPGRQPIERALDVQAGATVAQQIVLHDDASQDRVAQKTGGHASAPTLTSTDPPAQNPPSARELLDRAQEHRAQGQIAQAAAAYRVLLQSHPGSSEASAATVSLAIVELDHLGRPAKALPLFNRYLSRHGSGPVVQEALYGKARALRALGRRQQEREALTQFVDLFPGAFHNKRARQRLEELNR